MATPPREPSLNREQRRALGLLATIRYGITEGQLAFVHGFDRDMIAGLVDAGLATAHREVVADPGRMTIDVVRIIISDAGRRAVEG